MKTDTTDLETSGPPKAQRAKNAPKPRRERNQERLRKMFHDGLGQSLTSICFLAGSLRQKLAQQKMPEETEAAEIMSLTGRAISEAQALVREQEPPQRT
jgi:signal transduction histidine kinase